jgi:hypothetical protein
MIDDFKKSIFNVKDYIKFKEKPLWKVIVYILVLSVIFGFIFANGIQSKYREFLVIIPESYDEKVPEFLIKDGELKLDKSDKVIIEKNEIALIFDITDSENKNDIDKYKQGIVFLKDRFILKTSKNSEFSKTWNELNIQSLDKQTLRGYLGFIPSYIIMFTLFTILAFFINNLFISAFLALVFKVTIAMKKKVLSFLTIFKMSLYSLTTPIILIAIASNFLSSILKITQYYYAYYVSAIFLIIALYSPTETEKSSVKKDMKKQIKAPKSRNTR